MAMIYELEDIKKIRKKLGLTQKEVARMAGVSQSLLAKIESRKINPSYMKIKNIFNALDSIAKKNKLKAMDVMNRKVITTTPEENVQHVIKIMNKYGISQLPVLEEKKPVGLITESGILDKMQTNLNNIQNVSVKEIMDECPPIISPETDIDVILSLLKHFQIVLVVKNGDLSGIITKSDILGKVSSLR
jgi:predicted transcriptional regulator